VLNARRPSAQAARFLVAVHARLPACRVLVISEDPHLQATLAWESLNIRAMLPPSIDPGELLGRIAAMTAPPGDAGLWPRLSRPISHAVAYLAAHFGDDLKVDRLAEAAGISGSHLAHLFRAETGSTVRHYLNQVRVEIARDLLRHTEENLTEIAAFVGFFDASHLSRVFRQIVGQRPSAYRRATSVKRPPSDTAQSRARIT
jgi:AraC-like DNA-binding protein